MRQAPVQDPRLTPAGSMRWRRRCKAQHLGTSPLFDGQTHTRSRLLEMQAMEAKQAEREVLKLKQHRHGSQPRMEEKRNRTTGAEFQFVVITSASQPRGQYNYLLRTVLKLVNVLGQDPSSHVAVLDVGPDDPQVQMISDLVPVRRTSTELDGEGMLQHRKYLGKQLKDYASALGLCVESQARYCCVLEDDVIVSTHLLPILRILLGRIERKHRPSERWGMLKMYFKEAWMGFATEVWYEPVVIGVGGGMATFLFSLLRTFRDNRSVARKFARALTVAVPAGALCVLFAYLFGRPNLLQLRKAIPWAHAAISPAPTAITAGILYPNEVAGELQEFLLDLLRNGSVLASDIAVGEFMTVQHLPTYLAVPNLLDHIGFVSTNLMKVRSHKEHFGVWMP